MQPFTDDQLLELLSDIESDASERKRSFKGGVPDTARQVVCAFANDPFDLYPMPAAKLSDLSRVIFESEYLPVAFAADVLEDPC